MSGYHYDWTQRKYHADAYSEVPATLQRIGTLLAQTAMALQSESVEHSDDDDDSKHQTNTAPTFTASACIVNYYHTKSVMGAHQDDLEYDMTKPIVSLCLGHLPCLFVLGGTTVDDSAICPIILRPGDVVIMSGPSRLAYHAMARVLPVSLPAAGTVRVSPRHQLQRTPDEPLPSTDADRDALEEFLHTHRININLRQVYPDGQDPRQQQQQADANRTKGRSEST